MTPWLVLKRRYLAGFEAPIDSQRLGDGQPHQPGPSRGRCKEQRDHGDPQIAGNAGVVGRIGHDGCHGMSDGDRADNCGGRRRLRVGREGESTDAARRRALLFADHQADDFARVNVRRHETHEHGHGRDEMRFYYVCPVPKDLPDKERWRKLRAIGLAVNNTVRDGKECIEYRYYILSTFPSARRFARAVRSRWAIENRLHWQLDVTFQEDQSRVRKGHADVTSAACVVLP